MSQAVFVAAKCYSHEHLIVTKGLFP